LNPQSIALHHCDASFGLDFEVEVYDALSYTWGEPVYSQTLLVDNEFSMKITANLSEGLRTFCLGHHVRRIWADAICINQRDACRIHIAAPYESLSG